jgi:hypothetical protein
MKNINGELYICAGKTRAIDIAAQGDGCDSTLPMRARPHRSLSFFPFHSFCAHSIAFALSNMARNILLFISGGRNL